MSAVTRTLVVSAVLLLALAPLWLRTLFAAEPAPMATDPATVVVRELDGSSLSATRSMAAVRQDEAAWRAALSAEAFPVLRLHGTERPGSSVLLKEHRPGWFLCAGCALPLYSSSDKFDSGTGWPSFTRSADPGQVVRISDLAYGMVRTELRCARCDGHLGHVFNDGPAPTGERHCINGVSLRFQPLP